MDQVPVILRDISDTARWAAVFRARERDHPQPLFRDPWAERLAGPRGFEVAGQLSREAQAVSWVVRTYLFDQLIERVIRDGAELVVNLGAGLDARPYRMGLPSSLTWVEVDGAEILAHKKKTLAGEIPACSLEQVALDLRNRDARRNLFAQLGRRASRILVLTEGVLIYFHPEEVAALARDLAACTHVESWITEMVSPAVVDTMRRTAGQWLSAEQGSFQFGPAEGPLFFSSCGWQPKDVQSVFKTAVRLGRTPISPQFLDLVPGWRPGARIAFPWIGVCLLGRKSMPELSGGPSGKSGI